MKLKHAWALIPLFLILMAQADPHAGQPATCNNYHSNQHKCECHRTTSCERGLPEDSKCKTYCRPKACGCKAPCGTT